jgi:hypothetical protein
MDIELEKGSSAGSYPQLHKTTVNNATSFVDMDERRRAALAEIDNAKFSYVILSNFPY